MSQATIRLMNDVARRCFFGLGNDAPDYARRALRDGHYEGLVTLECDQSGERAAEEMFDLTNNPGRQDEREIRYGRLRSVSTGDIVVVDGDKYLCLSCGWALL